MLVAYGREIVDRAFFRSYALTLPAYAAMARSEAFLGVHPVQLIDDIYNFCTQYIKVRSPSYPEHQIETESPVQGCYRSDPVNVHS